MYLIYIIGNYIHLILYYFTISILFNSPTLTFPSTILTDSSSAKLVNTTIGIEDFAKVELTVGKILTCEKVEKSDKLLKLTVDIGEIRQVVSGIAKWYAPEALIGKKIILVSNLRPAVLRGVESNGMILASGEDEVKVVFIDDSVPVGSKVR